MFTGYSSFIWSFLLVVSDWEDPGSKLVKTHFASAQTLAKPLTQTSSPWRSERWHRHAHPRTLNPHSLPLALDRVPVVSIIQFANSLHCDRGLRGRLGSADQFLQERIAFVDTEKGYMCSVGSSLTVHKMVEQTIRRGLVNQNASLDAWFQVRNEWVDTGDVASWSFARSRWSKANKKQITIFFPRIEKLYGRVPNKCSGTRQHSS